MLIIGINIVAGTIPDQSSGVIHGPSLLMEDGFYLLLESGDTLLLE